MQQKDAALSKLHGSSKAHNQIKSPQQKGFYKSPQPIKQTPINQQGTINQGQERVNKVALLIPSNHMVNLLLYHHCIRDFIPLVVVPFFKEGHVPSSFTPRSETKDQPMPLGMSTLDPVQGP
jgi:hypothetical protein